MEVDYLVGSKEDFVNFLDSIGLYDKVAILTHTDLDGIASGLFLSEILKARGIKLDYIGFLEIKSDMVKEVSEILKEKLITKVIFSDLNIESIDPEGFEGLRIEKDVFLIDHHPIVEDLKDKSNIIKTVSEDCSALTTFILGEGMVESKSWGWLVSAAIFSDYSFKSKKNFMFMKTFYPELSYDEISSSIPGLNARKISSALIYYKKDVKHVYELVQENNISEFNEIYELIEEEVYRVADDFEKNKKYVPEKDIYIYEIKSKFEILSYVATLIAGYNPEKNFIFIYRTNDFVKISARSSNSGINMGKLMKEGVVGLEKADGGGHSAAAAARILPKDEQTFLKRILGDSIKPNIY
ncbi:hypothetical protein COU58_01485 [Candidatus Pacearchaeota archaeon CG10_big_fil_rev_8_21_14_0_10_32_42]|nr:MAG: hypothetical protein COU58_01485 [Candidatus Pacearchaeota archaeon CG10_big_fil_rev_8_21_14_0_10_32_42]